MATTKIGCQTVGAVWAYALNLWEQFATGTYTSWAYARSTLGTCRSVNITVGLSGGGTDVYQLAALDTDYSTYASPLAIVGSAGWKTMIQSVLPATVPGGGGTDVDYANGPKALRWEILIYWTNDELGGAVAKQWGLPDIGQLSVWTVMIKHNNQIMLDYTAIMWNQNGVLDQVLGMPTNLEGNAGVIVNTSSGGSVDLTPVVDALEDIATMDVEYQANNGGAVWSMRGKVRVP